MTDEDETDRILERLDSSLRALERLRRRLMRECSGLRGRIGMSKEEFDAQVDEILELDAAGVAHLR